MRVYSLEVLHSTGRRRRRITHASRSGAVAVSTASLRGSAADISLNPRPVVRGVAKEMPVTLVEVTSYFYSMYVLFHEHILVVSFSNSKSFYVIFTDPVCQE